MIDPSIILLQKIWIPEGGIVDSILHFAGMKKHVSQIQDVHDGVAASLAEKEKLLVAHPRQVFIIMIQLL